MPSERASGTRGSFSFSNAARAHSGGLGAGGAIYWEACQHGLTVAGIGKELSLLPPPDPPPFGHQCRRGQACRPSAHQPGRGQYRL